MPRRAGLLLAITMVACTGSVSVSTTTVDAERGSASARIDAPDFTLELGEGGSFSLSDGEKPVYLVFWAEW